MSPGTSVELERLAAATVFPGFPGLEPPDWIRRRLEQGLGGVVLYARNAESGEQLARLTSALRDVSPGVLIAIDEEGGDVTRLEAATGSSYPGNAALGAVDDVELTETVAAAMAADLAEVGVNLDFAPVADVNTNPQNPIIGIRSFGSEPELVARHVAAFVRGLQSRGVAACAKHFPGHGDTYEDSHLELPTVALDADTFFAQALPPFRAAIEAGAASIMTAHILVPALDSVPATTSRRILHELLREELGYDGLVMTDALEMRAISATIGEDEGAVQALAAGADALCLGHDLGDDAVGSIVSAIVDAVASGRLQESRLAEAAERVRRTSEWARRPRATDLERPSVEARRDAGSTAARRALLVAGDPALARTPLVVSLEPAPSIAAGASTGPGERLRRALPGSEVLRLSEGASDSVALDGRQLVVLVRDAHRHAWQRETADRLLADADDAIVVEVGLPHWRPESARGYVATFGAARVNLEAAAEILSGSEAAALYSAPRRGVEQSGSSPGS